MMKKIFYFDTETTGFDPYKNDIIQLAFLIEIDGKILEQGEFKIKPFNPNNLSYKALEVNGIKPQQLLKFPEPLLIYDKFLSILKRYVNPFDKQDKLIPAGYNVSFDLNFLKQFFIKCGDKYFGSFFSHQSLDVLQLVRWYDYQNKLQMDNHKLETAAKFFNIPIKAHDALSDIIATYNLAKTISQKQQIRKENKGSTKKSSIQPTLF